MLIDFQVTSDQFKSLYQEKKPLLIRGAVDAFRVSWPQINEIISRCNPASEGFRVSFPDGNVSKEKYIDTYFHVGEVRKKLNKSSVYEFLRKGATLVANSIYDEPAFNDYAREVGQLTGRQTVTSVYIAFGETDSYRAHWDSRDVFAIQLTGRKRWVVYKPSFEFPLFMHQSKFLEDDYPCPSEPYLDVVLEAGDIFYIPRGWWHNVSPLGEPTVHLAIGTFPAFGIDYVKWIFGKLPSCIHARAALEDYQNDALTIQSLSEHIAELMLDPKRYQDFMEEHVSNQRLETRLHLEKLGDASTSLIDRDALIRLNVLRTDISDQYWITSEGKIWLKDELKSVMHFLTSNYETTVGVLLDALPEFNEQDLRDVLYKLASSSVIEIIDRKEEKVQSSERR